MSKFKFTDENLKNQMLSNQENDFSFTDFSILKPLICSKGLQLLFADLNDSSLTIEEIASRNKDGLISDLKILSQRSLISGNFDLSDNEQLNKFLEKACKINDTLFSIEKISAIALDQILKPETSKAQLKTEVETALKSFTQTLSTQTKKDLEKRIRIHYVDESQEVTELSYEQFMNPKDTKLTGEQREFISTCWNQGIFDSGWLVASEFAALNRAYKTTDDRTQCLIDCSNGLVKIASGLSTLVNVNDPIDDFPEYIPGIKSAIEIDITSMKGDKFTPGMSSSDVKIDFEIEITPSINHTLKIPEEFQQFETKEDLKMLDRIHGFKMTTEFVEMQEENIDQIIDSFEKVSFQDRISSERQKNNKGPTINWINLSFIQFFLLNLNDYHAILIE